MNKEDWWPCTELTLQGNLTISGFAQKTWTARPSVCEIHLHAKSGMARIDWNHSSVVVSSAVIQHATLDMARQYELERQITSSTVYPTHTTHTTRAFEQPTPPRAKEAPDAHTTNEVHTTHAPSSRADEILAEFNEAKPLTIRRRPGRKPKAD